MRSLAASLLLLVCAFLLTGQSERVTAQSGPIRTRLLSETELEADRFVGADELGNLFYMKGQAFYRKSGDRVFSFSNVDLGEISQVDMGNPFKILLFYRDFNSVIILDNNLNELSQRLDFTGETQFNNVLYVANSSQNNIWLYADDNKLHLYNYQELQEQLQTQAMTFYEKDFEALGLVSTFKNVWIRSETEILNFNEYGNYVETYPLDGAQRIFPFQKGLLCYREGRFEYRTPGETRIVDLNHKGLIEDMSVSGSSLFIYDGSKVWQYELRL